MWIAFHVVKEDAGFLAIFGVELYDFDFALGYNACFVGRFLYQTYGIVKVFKARVCFGWL